MSSDTLLDGHRTLACLRGMRPFRGQEELIADCEAYLAAAQHRPQTPAPQPAAPRRQPLVLAIRAAGRLAGARGYPRKASASAR